MIYTSEDLLIKILGDISKKISNKVVVCHGWEDIVGVTLAERSFIKDIANSCVYICVRDGATKQLLLLKKQKILTDILKKYPGLVVSSIEVFIEKGTSLEKKIFSKNTHIQTDSSQSNIEAPYKDVDFFELLKRMKEYKGPM